MALKKFAEDRSVEARALQIYLILIGAAQRHEIITYGDLGPMLGHVRGGAFLAQQLGPLMAWCVRNKLPALTSLVVNRQTGIPGEGLSTVGENDFPAEQQRVFEYDWYSIYPPSLKELNSARAWLAQR